MPKRHIYSVTELTTVIKEHLEDAFPFVWLAGEISNFHTPTSGHHYFTLKDEGAQISAVMFRGQNRNLSFAPEDGMAILAMGRINVYEPRGVYQIIIEYLEPSGTGALQRAFEQLKLKLSSEGLFDDVHKKPLPFLPSMVAVVTSSTGAAIRDMLHVMHRRFPTLAIQIAPVKVQGEGANEEIAAAIEMLNDRTEAEVIVIARGGGSLEDLQAFNSEEVARAVYASRIPVVSAVGHETDFTICDFVADVRAPTPSAGAEIITPKKTELSGYLQHTQARLARTLGQKITLFKQRLDDLGKRLISPQRRLTDFRLRGDEMLERLCRAQSAFLKMATRRLVLEKEKLFFHSPLKGVSEFKTLLEHYSKSLSYLIQYHLHLRHNRFQVALGKLNAMNPLAVLERGYSITRSFPGEIIVRDAEQVKMGQHITVTLWRGSLGCRVEKKG